ncbi:hypothetical protein [Kallipyga gabonensis]|uniref:hypothetical protein n=1 Tax=Kallipyga gabonensis TaxID=1686287 RepID=UPI0006B48A6D|nr:hypothetical protein [Kallipyga gabonensis]
MSNLENELIKRTKQYRSVQSFIENQSIMAMEGWLEMRQSGTARRYYSCVYDRNQGKTVRKYLRKEQLGLAKELAQKAYYRKVQCAIDRCLPLMEELGRRIHEEDIGKLYDDLPDARKELIHPVMMTKKDRLAQWMDEAYSPNPMPKSSRSIVTKLGEIVRSKSEKILADLFYDAGVPYKYECPLRLRGGRILYPDFTFLDPRSLEEVYWEHFGLMDDVGYMNRALEKIKLYGRSGYRLGERLLVSFESSEVYIDFDLVRQTVEERLKWPG